MSAEEPRVDYVAPSGATHWKIKKRDEAGRSWFAMKFNVTQGNTDGSNVATVSIGTFPIAEWPSTLPAIVELLSSRWGPGIFRVWFYEQKDEKLKQVGGSVEFGVSPPAPPQAAAPAGTPQAAQPGAQPAAGVPFLGMMAQMFGGPAAPNGTIPTDPMGQAMMAFQAMMAWQRTTQEGLRSDADSRAAREREERDRIHRLELEQTRAFFLQVEKIKADSDRVREEARREAQDEIEELREEMEKIRAEAKTSGLPKGMEWLAVVEKLGPSVGPILEKALMAAVKAAASSGNLGAAAAAGAATGGSGQ